MAGGHATHGGIAFQNEVAVWMAIHVLLHKNIERIGGAPGDVPVRINLETTDAVDDLVVSTQSGGRFFVNVKSSVGLSEELPSPIGSVFDQFVRQWIHGSGKKPSAPEARGLSSERDRLILATQLGRNQSFIDALNAVLGRIRDKHQVEPRSEIATTAGQTDVLVSLVNLVNSIWRKHLGFEPDEAELTRFLSTIRVVQVGLESVEGGQITDELARDVLATESQKVAAINALKSIVGDFSARRSGGDAATLRDYLRAQTVSLKDEPQFQKDIAHLTKISTENLRSLERYSYLSIQVEDGQRKRIAVERKCATVLANAARNNSLLVIGDPGSGKSGALHQAASALANDGHPVVVFAVDQFSAGTIEDLSGELGLENGIVDVLRSWRSPKSQILFIDALDASRGGPSEKAISDLIRQVTELAPHWRVVASIRKFDLQFGAIYQELFPGRPVDGDYRDNTFPSVAHVNVPKLADSELSQITEAWPELREVIDKSNDSFKILLHVPFNLYLLTAILGQRDGQSAASSKTQLDLLERYWLYRVRNAGPAGGLARERLLVSILDSIESNRRLFVAFADLDQSDIGALSELLKGGVLVQADSSKNVSFAHHVLFDFALAKLRLLANGLAESLLKPDDHMLLIAPAAVLALKIVWDADQEHTEFWQLAFTVASAKDGGAFARTLPSRVAAESVQVEADVAYLLGRIGASQKEIRDASKFLVTHVFGVLIAKVIKDTPRFGEESDPWFRIALHICEKAAAQFIWPMKAVIGVWTENPASLTTSQLTDIGKVSRLILSATLENEANYDEGAIGACISGIGKSFQSDPAASTEAIRPLLNAERIPKYGHRELIWLVQIFSSTVRFAPELATEIFRAVCMTPLPSSDEVTNLGNSRILSLTSNKRQDFEGARYMLQEKLGKFLQSARKVAIPAFRDALVGMLLEEGRENTSRGPKSIKLFGRVLPFHLDHSSIWWNEDARNHDVKALLLDELTKAFQAFAIELSAEELRACADDLFAKDAWTSWITSLLHGLEKCPERQFPLALELVTNRIILECFDTAYHAGELIRDLHPRLTQPDRLRIENVVSEISDNDIKKRFLGCLSIENVEAESVKESLAKFGGKSALPENKPPFSFDAEWSRESDKYWWLRKEGVDTSESKTAQLLNLVETISSGIERKQPNEKSGLSFKNWNDVIELRSQFLAVEAPHKSLENTVWDAIARACEYVTDACKTESDLALFPNLHSLIYEALSPSLWPEAVFDSAVEEKFAKSPSWGSPSPRVSAASALMFFARAANRPTDVDSQMIEKLARDPSVVIRHTVLARVNVVCNADLPLAKRLVSIGFTEEQNPGVLRFFLGAFSNFMGIDPAFSASHILALEAEFVAGTKRSDREIENGLVNLMVRLWLQWDNDEAGNRIAAWAANPLKNLGRIGHLILDLRNLVSIGSVDEANGREAVLREKSRQVFGTIVENLVTAHATLFQKSRRTEEEQTQLIECTRLLDSAAHQLYFGSGAHDLSSGTREKDAPDRSAERKRFLIEYGPVLKQLAQVAYPSVTHPLLQTIEALVSDGPAETLDLLIEAVNAGGREGGYGLESLGHDLVVKLVRRFLADYPALVASTPEYRQGLITALNMFAEIGWPEARQLVYALPEMLR